MPRSTPIHLRLPFNGAGIALRVAFAVACVTPALPAWAQASPGAATAASLAKGKLLAAAKCQSCHGADGQAPNPDFPKLAGQLPDFLALQLTNYKSGERPHPVMGTMAKALSAQDITDLSAHYASLPPMRGGPAPPPVSQAVLAAGEAIFKAGKPGVPACQYCHGAQGQGVAPVFARLAGQHAKFVVAAIQPYRKVNDFKNPYAYVMKAVVQNLSDADIAAVAAYIESMK